jgi:hypothetical protein
VTRCAAQIGVESFSLVSRLLAPLTCEKNQSKKTSKLVLDSGIKYLNCKKLTFKIFIPKLLLVLPEAEMRRRLPRYAPKKKGGEAKISLSPPSIYRVANSATYPDKFPEFIFGLFSDI